MHTPNRENNESRLSKFIVIARRQKNMEVTNVSYTGYAATASVTKDKDGVKAEASAVSVSVSKTTITEDTYVPGQKADKETECIGYKPHKKLSVNGKIKYTNFRH